MLSFQLNYENIKIHPLRYINNFILKNKYNQLKFIHLFNAKIINIKIFLRNKWHFKILRF